MKKTAVVLILAMLALSLAACNPPQTSGSTSSTQPTTATATSETPSETSGSQTQASTTAAVETSSAASTAAETTAMPTPTVTPGPVMYSSYAHMVSYDPARGQADFDYFNMLRGDDAVQYLVDYEGYTVGDAQALVDDFADSEFVESNLNPQLRTIDLTVVDIKLMFYPDGTMLPGAEPVDSELIDLFDLYHVDPAKVLDYFFYYITVVDGEVVTVEQVYWP